jgi:hypothetical protein
MADGEWRQGDELAASPPLLGAQNVLGKNLSQDVGQLQRI